MFSLQTLLKNRKIQLFLLTAIFLLASTSPAFSVQFGKEIIMSPLLSVSSFGKIEASLDIHNLKLEGAGSGFYLKREAEVTDRHRYMQFSAQTGKINSGQWSLQLTLSWTRNANGIEKTTAYEACIGIARLTKNKKLQPVNKQLPKSTSVKSPTATKS
jgi:hypothetical protein